MCPVTRTDRQHPFHVPIPPGIGIDGVVMVDQLRSVDAPHPVADLRHALDDDGAFPYLPPATSSKALDRGVIVERMTKPAKHDEIDVPYVTFHQRPAHQRCRTWAPLRAARGSWSRSATR